MIDYQQSAFPESLLAQGVGTNFFCLTKLESPFRRADGRAVNYQLDYRWLSSACKNKDDEAYVCVQGNEMTYWSAKELAEIGLFPRRKKMVPDNYIIHDHLCF